MVGGEGDAGSVGSAVCGGQLDRKDKERGMSQNKTYVPCTQRVDRSHGQFF